MEREVEAEGADVARSVQIVLFLLSRSLSPPEAVGRKRNENEKEKDSVGSGGHI
jgi:hypothetical protein